jgi:recombination protein RecA
MAKESSKKIPSVEKRREASLKALQESLGKKSIGPADEVLSAPDIISTGYENLDQTVLTIGGFPLGTVVEIYGPEASGKGVICMKACASAQGLGHYCAWIDLERQMNVDWMSKNGINPKKLDVVNKAMSAEEVLETLIELIRSRVYPFIVVDSVAGMKPKIDKGKAVGDTQVGRLAFLLSDTLKDIVNECKDNNCTVLFINQTREKIGVTWGDPETTTGGKSLPFYASIRLRVQRYASQKIIKDNEQIGVYAKVDCVKSRYGPALYSANIPIYFDEYNPSPIDKMLEYALELKAITKRKMKGAPDKDFHFGDSKTGRLDGETRQDLLLSIIEQERQVEFVELFETQAVAAKLEVKDPEIVAVMDKMRQNILEMAEVL